MSATTDGSSFVDNDDTLPDSCALLHCIIERAAKAGVLHRILPDDKRSTLLILRTYQTSPPPVVTAPPPWLKKKTAALTPLECLWKLWLFFSLARLQGTPTYKSKYSDEWRQEYEREVGEGKIFEATYSLKKQFMLTQDIPLPESIARETALSLVTDVRQPLPQDVRLRLGTLMSDFESLILQFEVAQAKATRSTSNQDIPVMPDIAALMAAVVAAGRVRADRLRAGEREGPEECRALEDLGRAWDSLGGYISRHDGLTLARNASQRAELLERIMKVGEVIRERKLTDRLPIPKNTDEPGLIMAVGFLHFATAGNAAKLEEYILPETVFGLAEVQTAVGHLEEDLRKVVLSRLPLKEQEPKVDTEHKESFEKGESDEAGQAADEKVRTGLHKTTEKETTSEKNKVSNKKRKIPADEAERLVADYLKEHAKDDPSLVTVAAIHKATGVSSGSISNRDAWKNYCEKFKKSSKAPRLRIVPLKKEMLAVMPDSAVQNPAEEALHKLITEDDRKAELDELIGDQERDMQDDERPYKRRRL